jgi:hypothetical protein
MTRNPDSLVPLVLLADEFEAATIASLLREQGIPAQATGGFTSGFRAEAPGDVRVVVFRKDLERARGLLAEIHPDDEPAEMGEPAATGEDEDLDTESSVAQDDWLKAQDQKKLAFQYGLAALLVVQTLVGVVLAVFKVLSPTALGALMLAGAVACAMLYAVVLATVYVATDLDRGRLFSRVAIVVFLVALVAVELLVLLWTALR